MRKHNFLVLFWSLRYNTRFVSLSGHCSKRIAASTIQNNNVNRLWQENNTFPTKWYEELTPGKYSTARKGQVPLNSEHLFIPTASD